MAGKIEFSSSGIGELLRRGRLRVPPNQRAYAWDEKHVLALLQDFSGAIKDRDEDYFLGTIVLTGAKGEVPEVSDGQQRLATTTIILARIRDHFLALGKQKRAHRIETEYLRTTDLHTDDVVSKLTLNTDDNQFFVNTVLIDPAERAIVPQHLNLRESNLRLQKAVEVVDKHLHDITEQFRPENREAILADWVKFIDQRAILLWYTSPIKHLRSECLKL
jgi:Protein of unknown function DUF262